ncbi:MAG TPA: ABC transporter ATP-binding protein [Ilumatobacter sp.]|nr:ABC transporter ATP-binding protein [Ilumatobacter sp.]
MTAPAALLEYRNVVKAYQSGSSEIRALNDVSLSIAPGELVAVMGPSGCGKSTLLHLAGGLEPVTAGDVQFAGRSVTGMGVAELAELRRREIGYVFQQLNLIPSLTALENVALPLELNGAPARAAREAARTRLAAVGLDHSLDRYPDDFSGGQQQRIAIARATVGERRLVLADEPTGALDTGTADQVIDLLAGFARAGTAVVLVTHEPRFAAWADRVIFLRDGQVVDESAPFAAASGATGVTR